MRQENNQGLKLLNLTKKEKRMLKIEKAVFCITEQTLKELVQACAEARKTIEFTDEPMPDGDMATETYHRLQAERGNIRVTSDHTPIDFQISLETTKHTQESCGFQLNIPKKKESPYNTAKEFIQKNIEEGLYEGGVDFELGCMLNYIARNIDNPPKTHSNEGEEEVISFKHMQLIDLRDDKIVITDGGHWQRPLRMNLQWDCGKGKFVCTYLKEEKKRKKDEINSEGFLNWAYANKPWPDCISFVGGQSVTEIIRHY